MCVLVDCLMVIVCVLVDSLMQSACVLVDCLDVSDVLYFVCMTVYYLSALYYYFNIFAKLFFLAIFVIGLLFVN